MHHLGGRVKELDSLLKKYRRKKMDNPFTEMTDIVGIRVVYLFQGDLEIIKGVIRNSFKVVKEDDKLGEEEWVVTNFDTKITTQTEGTGYPSSSFSFRFEANRHLNYYIFRIFLPILIIIFVSWFIHMDDFSFQTNTRSFSHNSCTDVIHSVHCMFSTE